MARVWVAIATHAEADTTVVAAGVSKDAAEAELARVVNNQDEPEMWVEEEARLTEIAR